MENTKKARPSKHNRTNINTYELRDCGNVHGTYLGSATDRSPVLREVDTRPLLEPSSYVQLITTGK